MGFYSPQAQYLRYYSFGNESHSFIYFISFVHAFSILTNYFQSFASAKFLLFCRHSFWLSYQLFFAWQFDMTVSLPVSPLFYDACFYETSSRVYILVAFTSLLSSFNDMLTRPSNVMCLYPYSPFSDKLFLIFFKPTSLFFLSNFMYPVPMVRWFP